MIFYLCIWYIKIQHLTIDDVFDFEGRKVTELVVLEGLGVIEWTAHLGDDLLLERYCFVHICFFNKSVDDIDINTEKRQRNRNLQLGDMTDFLNSPIRVVFWTSTPTGAPENGINWTFIALAWVGGGRRGELDTASVHPLEVTDSGGDGLTEGHFVTLSQFCQWKFLSNSTPHSFYKLLSKWAIKRDIID